MILLDKVFQTFDIFGNLSKSNHKLNFFHLKLTLRFPQVSLENLKKNLYPLIKGKW